MAAGRVDPPPPKWRHSSNAPHQSRDKTRLLLFLGGPFPRPNRRLA